MQITVFRNVFGENLTSMERYANSLKLGLGDFPDISYKEFSVKRTGFIKPLRPLFHFLPWFKDYANDTFFSRYILYPQLARSQQGDINHITDQLNSNLLRVLDPKRTVVTCHDLIPLEYEKDPISLKVFKWNISFLSQAAKIIADSHATKDDLIKYLNISEKKIKVVYLGVDPTFRPITDQNILQKVKDKLKLPAGRFILFVGNNLAYKNRAGLLAAFEDLSKQHVDLSLIIVGAADSAVPSSSRVSYLSGLSEQDLTALYNLAAVYVQPSLKEGFGWPVIEAMACGTPVACSNASSLPELGGDVAEYFNPKDPSDIAGAVSRLLNLEESARGKIKEASIYQASKFNWNTSVKETVEVYNEVAAERL